MTQFSFDKTKIICRVIIALGVIVLLYGLWQYMPKEFDSDVTASVFWLIIAKRTTYPLSGLILILLGVMLLRVMDGTMREIEAIRNEILSLRKEVDKLKP
jgi:hypothetical protein